MRNPLLPLILGGMIAGGTTAAQPSLAADVATAAPVSAAAEVAGDTVEGTKAFQPPAGYNKRLRDGNVVYCRQTAPAGSRIKRTECFTEEQIAAIEQAQRAYREDVRKQGLICADGKCSGK